MPAAAQGVPCMEGAPSGLLCPQSCSPRLHSRPGPAQSQPQRAAPAEPPAWPCPAKGRDFHLLSSRKAPAREGHSGSGSEQRPRPPARSRAWRRAAREEVAEADTSSSGSSVISFQEQITFPAAKDMVDFNKNGNSQQTESGAGRAVVASPRCCQGCVAVTGEAGCWWVAAGQRWSCPCRAWILVLPSVASAWKTSKPQKRGGQGFSILL